jgi:hypothetical protein
MDIFDFFLNMDHYFFLIFCMELGDYKGVKDSRLPKKGQKMSKNELLG